MVCTGSVFTASLHTEWEKFKSYGKLHSIPLYQVSYIFYKAVVIEGYLTMAQVLWSVDYSLSVQDSQ